MNYLTEERKNSLCSEYVLGTLHGRARVRFQRLLMEHKPMRQALWRWEKHLNALGCALPERTPDPGVWRAIQRRLGFAESGADVVDLAAHRTAPARRWRWLASAASVAALALAAVLVWQQADQPPVEPAAPSQVAVVQGSESQALWLIELTDQSIQVQATDQFQPASGQDYELWLVAADGRAPVSLGLLPESGKLTLPRDPLFDRVQVAALAVSEEPPGGSPTGSPTKVLYTSQLVTL